MLLRVGRTLALTLTVLVGACGGDSPEAADIGAAFERRSDSFLEDYLASRPAAPPAERVTVDGAWFGLAFCPSGVFPVTMTIDGAAAQASLRPALGDPRRKTPFHLEHVDRSGTVRYAPESQYLLMEAATDPDADPRRARGLQIELLLAPSEPGHALLSIAETGERRPRECLTGIAGRGEQAALIEAFAGRLEEIRSDRRAVIQSACPDDYAAWLALAVEQEQAALTAPAFADTFGAPYLEMPADALLNASAVLNGSCVDGADQRTRIDQTRAAALLRDHRTYQGMFLAQARDRLARAWRAWADAQSADGARPSQEQLSGMLRMPLRFALAEADALAGFSESLAGLRDVVQAGSRELAWAERIEHDRDDFRALLAIEIQAASLGDVDMGLIATGLDYYLTEAAEPYAQSVEDAAEAAWLAAWLEQVRGGICPASRTRTCERAGEVVEKRLDRLADTFADAEDRDFEALTDQDPGLPRLAAMVQFERAFRSRYGALAGHPRFARGIEDRAEVRQRAQARLDEALLALAASTRTAPALQAIESDHFLENELAALPALRSALDMALQTTRPFSGLPGGDYLDALYNRDFAGLQRLDDRYLEGIMPLMRFGAQQMMLVGDLVDAASGEREGTSAARLRRDIEKMSALYAVMGTYLLDYEDVHAACLGPDAATFVVETRTDQVTRDGFGNVIRRQEGWTNRESYRVKPEFSGQIRTLFDAAGGTGFQALDLFLNDARIGRLRAGVRDAMRSRECDDPELLQLERGLLAYDAQLRRR